MAVTNADILGWLNANPGADAALINQTMAEAGVSAAQYQSATGAPPPPVPQAMSLQQVVPPPPLAQTLLDTGVNTGYGTSVGVTPPIPERLSGGPVQVLPPVPTVTNADILGWLNANPNATPSLINETMKAAGVSANQYQSATGAPPPSVAPPTVTDYQGNSYDSNAVLALAKELAPTMNSKQLAGGVYNTQGESIGFNYDEATKLLGRPPSAAEQVVLDMSRQLLQKDITSLSQLPATDTSTRFGSTFTGGGGTIYEIQKDPTTGAITTSTWGKTTSDKGNIVAALSIGAGLLGIPTSLGTAILGTGANTIAAGALGGGLFGGAAAGLTGGNILQGALMGAAGGAAGEYFRNPVTGEVSTVPTESSVPFTGADYSLANGVGPQGLESMGGAQGLQPGTSANLPNMGGAQGITLNLGPASTTLANALSTFGGMNPANLDAMGGAQGLTYQTPTGLVTQGGVIPTGGSTGNNNVIGETGVNTAYNIGNGIGDALAAVDTNVYNPSGGMLSPTVTGFNPNGTPTTTAPTGSILDNLTPSQIANIISGVGGLIGGAGIARAVTPKTTPMGVSIPTQGVPLNTADYYRAIQQNYNRLLPAVPRDVATPLAQWYNSTYGA